MEIRWLSAFIDLPASEFDEGTRFWQEVAGSGISPLRGEMQEFATMLPPSGDPYLRVQRTANRHAGFHLDVHVAALAEAQQEATRLGATVLADHGYLVMASPAGLVFCLVLHHGEYRITQPVDADRPHVLDQICIDIPSARFDEECAFWEAFIEGDRRSGSRPEFEYLVRDPALPLRLLFQRLEGDDPASEARAHLDFACGAHRAEIAAEHQRPGAEHVRTTEHWVTLSDPAGLHYCLTRREPYHP